jgi:hypothetical protein
VNIVCTYCSASKDPDPGHLPAFRRYISNRIDHVHDIAEHRGAHFCILSGRFGLVDWDEAVPSYDHLLKREEVEDLAGKVSRQLQEKGVSSVEYVTLPAGDDPHAALYRVALQKACMGTSIEYKEETIDPSDFKGSLWRKIMEEAADAREVLKSDRKTGIAAFAKLVALHPKDGMVYFQRASGYQAIREFDLARSDFETARDLFPLERWKREAERAIETLAREQSWGGTVAEARHRLDALRHIDRDIRGSVVAAVNMMESNLTSSAGELRRCAELVVAGVVRELGITPEGDDLDKRIRLLGNKIGEHSAVVTHLHTARRIGNVASHRTHGDPALQRGDVYASLNALVTVLEWWNSRRKSK